MGELGAAYLRCDRPQEHADDAQTLHDIAQVQTEAMARLARRAEHGQRTADDFVAALRRLHGMLPEQAQQHGGLSWTSLCAAAGSYICAPPGAETMLGPMDVSLKARARAVRQRRRGNDDDIEAVRPDDVTHGAAGQAGRQQEQEQRSFTDSLAEEMLRRLRRVPGGVMPWRFVALDPCGFAQTVENNFALSHLVNQRKAWLGYDEEWGAVVHAVPVPGGHKGKEGAAERREDGGQGAGKAAGGAGGGTSGGGSGGRGNVSLVLRLNMEDWRGLCSATDPAAVLMEHRPDPQGPAAAAPAAAAVPLPSGPAARQGR